MGQIKIPYFVTKPNKDGTARYYWQPSKALAEKGFRTEILPDTLGAALERAKAKNLELQAWREGQTAAAASGGPAAGSLSWLIGQYREAFDFKKNSLKTRKGYEDWFPTLEAWGGDLPAGAISKKSVQRFYRAMYYLDPDDPSAGLLTPAKANAVMRVLSTIMSYGMREHGLIANPCAKMKLKGLLKGGVIWPLEAVELFALVADVMGMPSIGDAIAINEWLGQRQNDLLAMPRVLRRGGEMIIRQSKTGKAVSLPIGKVPKLAARIDAAIKRQDAAAEISGIAATTLIVCEATGLPYSEYHFRHCVAAVRAVMAELVTEWDVDYITRDGAPTVWTWDLKSRFLRHTAVVRMAECGCTKAEISAVTGHSDDTVDQILEHYLVRTSKMASNAFDKRIAAEAQFGLGHNSNAD